MSYDILLKIKDWAKIGKNAESCPKTSPFLTKKYEFGEVLGRAGLMEVYLLSFIDDNMMYFLSPINDKMMMLISIRLNFR